MAKIREEMRGRPKEEALKAAVEYCVKHEILLEFLKNNATEVMNMLTAEWDWDVAKKVWQDESRDEGIQLGEARGIQLGEARAATQYEARIADDQRRFNEMQQEITRLKKQLYE